MIYPASLAGFIFYSANTTPANFNAKNLDYKKTELSPK